ncbi:MAG: cell division protein ZapE [Francisellaceae bacterium]
MSLIDLYLQKCQQLNLKEDGLQRQALDQLSTIQKALNDHTSRKHSWFRKNIPDIKGLYLWGGVGRGKTFIMDLFYEALDEPKKQRQHFNHFMKQIHAWLRKYQGQKDPLQKVAEAIAEQYRIICFDEFFVEDIADAMILGGLFKALFEKGIILVATSNIPPDRLYAGGLQRQLFLPAIEALKQHVTVFNLDSGIDYRQRELKSSENYFYPSDHAKTYLSQKFSQIAIDADAGLKHTDILLEDRKISIIAVASNIIWFDFFAICGHARGVSDYITLARTYKHVIIANIPILTEAHENESRRFIALVDEFYDENTHLIISAATHYNDIYQGQKLIFQFERTLSRLKEMQSEQYMAAVQEKFFYNPKENQTTVKNS